MDSLAMSQRRRRLEEARRALELIGAAGRDAVSLRWIAVAGRSRRCEAGAPIGSGWGASASGSPDEVSVGSISRHSVSYVCWSCARVGCGWTS